MITQRRADAIDLKLAGVDWLTIGRKLAAATDPEAASPEHHARHHQRHHGTTAPRHHGTG